MQSGSYLGEDDIVRSTTCTAARAQDARMSNLNSFKAYDIRGPIPSEINEELAYDIGRAYAAS